MRGLTAEAILVSVLWRTGVIRARQSDPHHRVTGRRASMGKAGVETRFTSASRTQKEWVPARERGIRGKESAPSRSAGCASALDAISLVQRRSHGLGDFLKARRAQLTPHEVGLPEAGAHRTAEAGTPSHERLCILASWNAELACGVPALPVPGEDL